MLKKILLFVLICCTSIIMASTSQNDFKTIMGKITTLSTNFSQVMYDEYDNVIEESEGIFKLKKPASLIWHTKKPHQQLITKNSENVWIYDIDLEQVTVQSSIDIKKITILSLLLDEAFELSEHFNSLSKTSMGQTEYIFIPKSDNMDFKKLSIFFKDNKLSSMKILDSFNSKTYIKFSDVQTNKDIPSKTFYFQAPDGVDVIYQ